MKALLKIIQQNAERTGNLCGISLVKLARKSGYTHRVTQQQISNLLKEEKIKIREGINHQLIFPYE